MREAMMYSNAAGSSDMGAGTLFSVAAGYASLDALAAAVGSANGVVERFDESDAGGDDAPTRYLRGVFGATIKGTDGQTLREQAWLVLPSSLDGKPGVRLVKLADITWTASGTAVDTSLGARGGHVEAKAISLTDSGAALALTGQPLGVVNSNPAVWSIVDVGEAVGVLRLFYAGTSSGGAGMRQRWR